jgi:hypothetical protein
MTISIPTSRHHRLGTLWTGEVVSAWTDSQRLFDRILQSKDDEPLQGVVCPLMDGAEVVFASPSERHEPRSIREPQSPHRQTGADTAEEHHSIGPSSSTGWRSASPTEEMRHGHWHHRVLAFDGETQQEPVEQHRISQIASAVTRSPRLGWMDSCIHRLVEGALRIGRWLALASSSIV